MDERTHDRPREATIRQLSELPLDDNRRRHLRYAVELDVSMSSEHNFYAGFAENLSEGGVFVATHSLLAGLVLSSTEAAGWNDWGHYGLLLAVVPILASPIAPSRAWSSAT